MLATLTEQGRAAMIAALADRTLHLAWGTGDPAWDTDDTLKPALFPATALTAEVGRRLVHVKNFCVPDPDGDISVVEGVDAQGKPLVVRFRTVTEATPHLYIRVIFDYGEAWQHTIREVALFSDAVTDPALPPGQLYFEPHQVLERGRMVVARHEKTVDRDPTRQDTYELVVSL